MEGGSPQEAAAAPPAAPALSDEQLLQMLMARKDNPLFKAMLSQAEFGLEQQTPRVSPAPDGSATTSSTSSGKRRTRRPASDGWSSSADSDDSVRGGSSSRKRGRFTRSKAAGRASSSSKATRAIPFDEDETESDSSESELDEAGHNGTDIPQVVVSASSPEDADAEINRVEEDAVDRLRSISEFDRAEWSKDGHKVLRTYVRDVATRVQLARREHEHHRGMRQIYAEGPTQSGKTGWKVICVVVAHIMGVPCFVCTTNVHGMHSLTNKVRGLLESIAENKRPPVLDIQTKLRRDALKIQPMDRLKHIFMHAGVIMVNDTANAVAKADALVCQVKGNPEKKRGEGDFVLIMDEADAFQRTRGKEIKLEQALIRFNKHRPLLNLSVSATLLPVYLEHANGTCLDTAPSIYCTRPDEDYNGCRDLVPAVDTNGNRLFLLPKELQLDQNYMNEKTDLVLERAFTQPRSLALMITSSRVAAQGGIHCQAKRMRELKGGDNVITLLIDGSGITEYPPGGGQAFKHPKKTTDGNKKTISLVIQDCDERYGLDRPMVIIGYSQMQRGESFRSNNRVPTHIVCALGPSQSIEKMVQAAGRATFRGKAKLNENGFENVEILTLCADFDTLVKYPIILQEIRNAVAQGKSLSEVLLDSEVVFTDNANILKLQKKSIGNAREKHNPHLSFEEGPAGEGEKYLKEMVQMEMTRLEQLCLDLARTSPVFAECSELHSMEMPGKTAEAFLVALHVQHVNRHGNDDDFSFDVKMVSKALKVLVDFGFFKKRKAERGEEDSGKQVYWKLPESKNILYRPSGYE